MRQWPEGNETVPFDDLAGPIVQALADAVGNGMVWCVGTKRHASEGRAYGFASGTSSIKSIDYAGYDIPDNLKHVCQPPDKRLSREGLRFDWEDQGRNPVEVIVGLAIQLGIEQGRRIERQQGTDGQTLDLIRRLLGVK